MSIKTAQFKKLYKKNYVKSYKTICFFFLYMQQRAYLKHRRAFIVEFFC